MASVPVAVRRGRLRLQDRLHRVRHLRLHPHSRHIHRREARMLIALCVLRACKIQWRSVNVKAVAIESDAKVPTHSAPIIR